MSGTLYLVGTPIGNLKDITYRAVETLGAVDIIASEDTRHTRILLDHYGIKKPLISYHMHKEREGTEEIIDILMQDKSVALVSDAGMPCISDPGAILVAEIHKRGLDVKVVPGATAVASAVALSGASTGGFTFVGFLPEKLKDKKAIVENLKTIAMPLVFYSAPHDLEKTISFLFDALGDRKLWAVKEITKMFETVYIGSLSNINIANMRGEFVLIVDGANVTKDEIDIKSELQILLDNGSSKSQAVKDIAKKYGIAKNKVYEVSLEL
ncbi:MAG: 16S rRNA (cytidine(1402)-2'-O)-methyltransferase [Bacillota bacterium]